MRLTLALARRFNAGNERRQEVYKRSITVYSRVQLLTDKFRQEGAAEGSIGYVIEVYDNGDCEVEFSSENGISYAQIVAAQADLKIAEPVHTDSEWPKHHCRGQQFCLNGSRRSAADESCP